MIIVFFKNHNGIILSNNKGFKNDFKIKFQIKFKRRFKM